MRWWTECSVNKLNARCHRTFPLHTSLPRIPHRQVAAGMPFLGWPWRCHGPSPWSMEGGEGKGECTGLCLLHFSLRASLSLYPISQPPAPCKQKPRLPILGVALGMSFLGCSFFWGESHSNLAVASFRKITSRAAVISASIIIMTLQSCMCQALAQGFVCYSFILLTTL